MNIVAISSGGRVRASPGGTLFVSFRLEDRQSVLDGAREL